MKGKEYLGDEIANIKDKGEYLRNIDIIITQFQSELREHSKDFRRQYPLKDSQCRRPGFFGEMSNDGKSTHKMGGK